MPGHGPRAIEGMIRGLFLSRLDVGVWLYLLTVIWTGSCPVSGLPGLAGVDIAIGRESQG